MPRVKGGYVTRRRRKRTLKLAKGYFGSKHILYKTAHEQVMKSLSYAYRDRKQVKRNFRKLWITRINAACRMQNLSYSKFMHGLKIASVDVNRKVLADLAVNDLNGFNKLIEVSKDALVNPNKYQSETVVAVKKPKKEETVVEVKKEQPKKEEKVVEVKKEQPKKEEKVVEVKKEQPKKEEKVVEVKKEQPKKEEKVVEVKKEQPKKEEVKVVVEEKEAVKNNETAEELSKLTVAKLKEIAKERGITIPSGSRKAAIVELLAK